jgi:hypothetical protein
MVWAAARSAPAHAALACKAPTNSTQSAMIRNMKFGQPRMKKGAPAKINTQDLGKWLCDGVDASQSRTEPTGPN